MDDVDESVAVVDMVELADVESLEVVEGIELESESVGVVAGSEADGAGFGCKIDPGKLGSGGWRGEGKEKLGEGISGGKGGVITGGGRISDMAVTWVDVNNSLMITLCSSTHLGMLIVILVKLATLQRSLNECNLGPLRVGDCQSGRSEL